MSNSISQEFIEIGLNMTLHEVSKVIELVAKEPKYLVTRLELPLFVIKIIEISLKDQNNDSHVVSKVMELVAKAKSPLLLCAMSLHIHCKSWNKV